MKRKRLIRTILGITGAISAFQIYLTFRRQKVEAVIELYENSQTIETACGSIEYTKRGAGATVLLCHGGGNGYDQGSLFSWLENSFQILTPSRPGYLRTPLEIGETGTA